MLARAAPLRGENNEVLRWYGTNTDIHEATVARLQADNIKDQIMAVLAHADISLFAINNEKKVTMAEGQTLVKLERMSGHKLSGFVGLDAFYIARTCDSVGSISRCM